MARCCPNYLQDDWDNYIVKQCAAYIHYELLPVALLMHSPGQQLHTCIVLSVHAACSCSISVRPALRFWLLIRLGCGPSHITADLCCVAVCHQLLMPGVQIQQILAACPTINPVCVTCAPQHLQFRSCPAHWWKNYYTDCNLLWLWEKGTIPVQLDPCSMHERAALCKYVVPRNLI